MLKLFGGEYRVRAWEPTASVGEQAMSPSPDVRVAWAVENLSDGTRYPVLRDRFRIGSDPDADIVVPGLEDGLMMLFHANGEIWLGIADKSHEIAAEEPFDIGGVTLVVRTVFDGGRAPVSLIETYYPYMLHVRKAAFGTPYALIEDIATGARHRLVGGASALLLYLLARKRVEDEAAGIGPTEAGWCDQRDVMVGTWGPAGDGAPFSRLNLLVCGIRQGLREAGFDPWFIEKRRGAIRLRALAIRVDDASLYDPDEQPTDPDIKVPLSLMRRASDPDSTTDPDPGELAEFEPSK